MVLISMKNTFFVLRKVLAGFFYGWWMGVCKRHVEGKEEVAAAAAAEVSLVN